MLAAPGSSALHTEQALARTRLANLSAAALACGHEACARSGVCIYSGLCLYAPGRQVQAVLAGRVSPEQPTCSRTPTPYFCDSRPTRGRDANKYHSFRAELRDAKTQCWTHENGNLGQRKRDSCLQRVGKLTELKQLSTICANWCPVEAGTYPVPSCTARAVRLWKAAANGQLDLRLAFSSRRRRRRRIVRNNKTD